MTPTASQEPEIRAEGLHRHPQPGLSELRLTCPPQKDRSPHLGFDIIKMLPQRIIEIRSVIRPVVEHAVPIPKGHDQAPKQIVLDIFAQDRGTANNTVGGQVVFEMGKTTVLAGTGPGMQCRR